MNLTPHCRNQKPSRHDPLKKSCLPNLNMEVNVIFPVTNLRSQSITNRRVTRDLIIKKNLRDIRLLMPMTTVNCESLSINKIPNSQIIRDSSRRNVSSKRRPLLKNGALPQRSLSPLKSNYTRDNQANSNTTIEVSGVRDLKTIDYVLRDLDDGESKKRIIKNKREVHSRPNQEDDFGLVSTRERRDLKRCFEVTRLESNYFKSSPVSLLNLDDETPCFGPPNVKFVPNRMPIKLSLDLNVLKPPKRIKKNVLTPKIASLNQIESSRQSDLSIDEYLIIHEYEQNKARLKEFAQAFRKKIFENTLKLPKRKVQIAPLLRLKLLNRRVGKIYG